MLANASVRASCPFAPRRRGSGAAPETANSAISAKKEIRSEEIEYEVKHGEDAVTELRFHLACRSVWQLEVPREEFLRGHSPG